MLSIIRSSTNRRAHKSHRRSASAAAADYLIVLPFSLNIDWLYTSQPWHMFTKSDVGIQNASIDGMLHSENNKNEIRERKLIERLYRSRNVKEAFAAIRRMWIEERFCDLILTVDRSEYVAHRIALAYHSSTYR
jgi:hypothetical protein